jgi:hypothetical protein
MSVNVDKGGFHSLILRADNQGRPIKKLRVTYRGKNFDYYDHIIVMPKKKRYVTGKFKGENDLYLIQF